MIKIVTLGRILMVLMLGAAAGGVLYGAANGRLDSLWSNLIDPKTHWALVVGLFVTLPLVGLPISIFLLLLGIKFGPVMGCVIMVAGMAVHTVIFFLTADTLLRPLIEKELYKIRYHLPRFSDKGFYWAWIVFIAVPGLPYILKNYIFSLSGVPFRYFFLISWGVHSLFGIPMIIAGNVARHRQSWIVWIFLAGILLSYGILRWIKKRRENS
jgi:uncharacterized membrane protein YdjX (TVP38/TMEM64 family)